MHGSVRLCVNSVIRRLPMILQALNNTLSVERLLYRTGNPDDPTLEDTSPAAASHEYESELGKSRRMAKLQLSCWESGSIAVTLHAGG